MDIDEINPSREWFFTKLGLLAVFVAGDVYLNSKAEYEALHLGQGKMNTDELEQLQMILFGCSLVLQLSIASSIFLIVSNTFPFQVGLWVEMQNRFKWLLIVQPMYMVLSCIVGGIRLVRSFVRADSFGSNITLSHPTSLNLSDKNQVFNGNTDLWRWWYSTISALHKLGENMWHDYISLLRIIRIIQSYEYVDLTSDTLFG